jgi:hypothetical protein
MPHSHAVCCFPVRVCGVRQRFVDAMWSHPTVLSSYDEGRDGLVLALHHAVPRLRFRATKESVLDVSTCLRPDFPQWRSWSPAFVLPSPEQLRASGTRGVFGVCV